METWEEPSVLRQKEAELRIVLQCTARKRGYPSTPLLLYDPSTYFRLSLSVARCYVPDANILVLSAKYGLTYVHQVLKPYDLKLTDLSKGERALWVSNVKTELEKLERSGCRIVFLCSHLYSADFGYLNLIPAGLGIGEQLSYLKAWHRRITEKGLGWFK